MTPFLLLLGYSTLFFSLRWRAAAYAPSYAYYYEVPFEDTTDYEIIKPVYTLRRYKSYVSSPVYYGTRYVPYVVREITAIKPNSSLLHHGASNQTEKGGRSARATPRFIQQWRNFSDAIPFNVSLASNPSLTRSPPFKTYTHAMYYNKTTSGFVTEYLDELGHCDPRNSSKTHACEKALGGMNTTNTTGDVSDATNSLRGRTSFIASKPFVSSTLSTPGHENGTSTPTHQYILLKKPIMDNVTTSTHDVSTDTVQFVPGKIETQKPEPIVEETLQPVVEEIMEPVENEHLHPKEQETKASLEKDGWVYDVTKDGEPGQIVQVMQSEQKGPALSTHDQTTNSTNMNGEEVVVVPVEMEPVKISSDVVSNTGNQETIPINMGEGVAVHNENITVNDTHKPSRFNQFMKYVMYPKEKLGGRLTQTTDGLKYAAVAHDNATQGQMTATPVSGNASTRSGATIEHVLKDINMNGTKGEHANYMITSSAMTNATAPHVIYENITLTSQFPIHIPQDGDFIFYGLLFDADSANVQEAKFTGEPDGRVKVTLSQGEFIVDPFTLVEGSPLTTLWNKQGDEARLLQVEQNNQRGFFLKVDKYRLAIIDKRFLIYSQPTKTA